MNDTTSADMVAVDDLDAFDVQYLKPAERDGQVSRAAIQLRRSRFEDSILRRMGAAGEGLNVREQLDRPGEKHLLTTAVASTIDLTERAR